MNDQPTKAKLGLVYAVAILGALLIVAILVWAMQTYTQPEPLNANRAAERAKALKELRASEADALHNPAWIDKSKGIVRLPIDVAVQMVEQEWKNPAAARADLIKRVEKATAVPPKAPEKPSMFE